MENKAKEEIPLDTSFFEDDGSKLTFSLHKVTPKEVPKLVSSKKAFEGAFARLLANENKSKPSKSSLGTVQDLSLNREAEKNQLYVNSDIPGTVAAISFAFAQHKHLVLSPSDFIILIGQGLATHINMNSEKFRNFFVEHEGKEKIIVLTSDLKLDGKGDWSPIFPQFCEEIKNRVKKDIHEIFIDNTSVATQTTKIVSELNLMDSMKNYFDYVVKFVCGFPKITLKGKPEDWKLLLEKVQKIKEMNGTSDELELDWWLKNLIPITEKICEAGTDRKIDHLFWSNLFQESKSYGGHVIKGWINAFLPYINDQKGSYERNGVLNDGFIEEKFVYKFGITNKDIREGISEVPFVYEFENKKHNMHFFSGFLGAKYDKTSETIEPAYFWCVSQDK